MAGGPAPFLFQKGLMLMRLDHISILNNQWLQSHQLVSFSSQEPFLFFSLSPSQIHDLRLGRWWGAALNIPSCSRRSGSGKVLINIMECMIFNDLWKQPVWVWIIALSHRMRGLCFCLRQVHFSLEGKGSCRTRGVTSWCYKADY